MNTFLKNRLNFIFLYLKKQIDVSLTEIMISTNIGNVEMASCVFNASGPRTYSIEALKKIAESCSGAVLAKSATLQKCDGNQLPRCVNKLDLGKAYSEGSINSEGLPNGGIGYC